MVMVKQVDLNTLKHMRISSTIQYETAGSEMLSVRMNVSLLKNFSRISSEVEDIFACTMKS
jgi:hypothetical protein